MTGARRRKPTSGGEGRSHGGRGRQRLRLSGGEYGGRILGVPQGIRPTEGRVREALFSIWGPRLSGARLADLFAGSGAMALEALGRGALEAVAIEDDEAVATVLAANAASLGVKGLAIHRGKLPLELARMVRRGEVPLDLVFADPPYRYTGYSRLLEAIAPLLATDGEVAVEHSRRTTLPEEAGGLVRVNLRRYGESGLSFYRHAPA